jgi:tetratricopeptide (TPR) repeat protein
MIYSTYLSSNKRLPEAVAQLEQATAIAGESAFTHYNIGLAYYDLNIYDKALTQAHRALALDFQRTELQELLQKAGQWQEPGVSNTSTPASAQMPVQ